MKRWGLPKPPEPLAPEEFARRYREGARTLAEIHPEFERWRQICDRRLRRMERTTWFFVALGAVGLLGSVLLR